MNLFNKKRLVVLFILSFYLIISLVSCLDEEKKKAAIVSSKSYSGHESDMDANNFVGVYTNKVGTRLDDCQLCHGGGTVQYYKNGDTSVAAVNTTITNPCQYCHISAEARTSGYPSLDPDQFYKEDSLPQTFAATLNAYGLAYLNNGRSQAAIRTIENQDSDGDAYSNIAEITENRYPGDVSSKPDQQLAPTKIYTMSQVKALANHTQFMLMNTTKQQYDDYTTYTGVTIRNLLIAAGVNPDDASFTGITVIAPDGYQTTYSKDAINKQFPNGTLYNVPAFADTAMNFITYPNPLPAGVTMGAEITNPLYLILAFQREGLDLDSAYYEPTYGRLEGEGPFRLVIPQSTASRPDRGSKAAAYGDGWDYSKPIDHNAGKCVRGVSVIRVEPMPSGYEEFDWKNTWSLIQDKSVVIYGYGITAKK